MEKLDQRLTVVHRHNKMTPVKEKHMRDLIVACQQCRRTGRSSRRTTSSLV
ncbi:hypothetical protein [Bradyrhizobium valentinum]|uniref:hypothetical protein n=1 Tax=Bradyrhizobium valentinum TaxID=1518501 RepID=UPI000B2729B7|nr:hypothetical protein [Bradyrhizobium valentinum]